MIGRDDLRGVGMLLDAKSMPEPNSGCWLWTGVTTRDGYGRIWVGGKKSWARAHRLAWMHVYGAIPAKLFVCHKCDVRSCINPAHLFLGTPGDNCADMIAKGRKAKAPAHTQFPIKPHRQRVKLTLEQVVAIRSDRRAVRVIAAEYGVVNQTISKIRLGQRWMGF